MRSLWLLCACLVVGVAHAAQEHPVSDADSWSSLAAEYWKDAGLARELAAFCGGDPAQALRAGETLRIPELVEYQVQPGDTLRAIARARYTTADSAAALARINQIEDPSKLLVGQRLRIPGDAAQEPVRLAPYTAPPTEAITVPPTPAIAAPPTPAVAAPARKARRERSPAAAAATVAGPAPQTAELRRAVNAYLDGDFDGALELLEQLRTPVLANGARDDQTTLLRTLLFVYVAFDRNQEACDAVRGLRALDAEPAWDADAVSPKILAVVRECDGG